MPIHGVLILAARAYGAVVKDGCYGAVVGEEVVSSA